MVHIVRWWVTVLATESYDDVVRLYGGLVRGLWKRVVLVGVRVAVLV